MRSPSPGRITRWKTRANSGCSMSDGARVLIGDGAASGWTAAGVRKEPGSRKRAPPSLSSAGSWPEAARALAGGLHRLGAPVQLLLDGLEEVQPVAPDDDLVAVGQDPPLDALAVDEHAVEAAVVQDPHSVRPAHDQRVPARHGRVVEADVRRKAAPHPRPLVLQRGDLHAPALGPRQVLTRLPDHLARAGEKRRALLRRRLVAGPALEALTREQRRPGEAGSAAPRAIRQ